MIPAESSSRLLFIIRSLGVGGAERHLATLVTGPAARGPVELPLPWKHSGRVGFATIVMVAVLLSLRDWGGSVALAIQVLLSASAYLGLALILKIDGLHAPASFR